MHLDLRWYALAYVAGWCSAGATCGAMPAIRRRISRRRRWTISCSGRRSRSCSAGASVTRCSISRPISPPIRWRILELWRGGMSFHGGWLGVALAMILFARRRGLSMLRLSDALTCAAPIGLFFGRIANFINGELFGRVSDVPWAMVFPAGGPEPRHPSQLYEALSSRGWCCSSCCWRRAAARPSAEPARSALRDLLRRLRRGPRRGGIRARARCPSRLRRRRGNDGTAAVSAAAGAGTVHGLAGGAHRPAGVNPSGASDAPTALAARLAATIRHGGPISIAHYMAEALANPAHGYYVTRDPFGASGDFTTAPETSQMFGELVGLWCADLWLQMGRPDPVHLVELGPGRGTLMADALRATRAQPGFPPRPLPVPGRDQPGPAAAPAAQPRRRAAGLGATLAARSGRGAARPADPGRQRAARRAAHPPVPAGRDRLARAAGRREPGRVGVLAWSWRRGRSKTPAPFRRRSTEPRSAAWSSAARRRRRWSRALPSGSADAAERRC